eukprot:CAMPEP_0172039036 /NCGR_PEP_ID=MMETSP1041-20130122/23665_1 /TAXON_ID=464988 /ORGANISM="Hemiselmis andersenii, Strain CCMP439" /LENGTH=101 /DNA_ID=CAMNT_0012696669 /DNA_START=133 /DNA_END=435 /DNA_ORIENTATION=-
MSSSTYPLPMSTYPGAGPVVAYWSSICESLAVSIGKAILFWGGLGCIPIKGRGLEAVAAGKVLYWHHVGDASHGHAAQWHAIHPSNIIPHRKRLRDRPEAS